MMRGASSRWRLTGTFLNGSGGGNETRLPGQGLGTFSSFERQSGQVHPVTTNNHRMTKTPESLKTATGQSDQVSEPAIPAPEISDSPTQIICDLADSDAFVETYRKPHVPVMSAFGAGRLHVFRFYG
jgi:hypothetical protein